MSRECRHHGLVEHGYYGGRYRCKRCVGEAVTRRHQKVRSILIAEGGGRCALCGYDRCVVSLHFHHVDPSTKSFEMHMGRGNALDTYRLEATKCVLVCANCHGEIEAGLLASPPAGSTYESLRSAPAAAPAGCSPIEMAGT